MASKQMAQWEIDALLQNIGGNALPSGPIASPTTSAPTRKSHAYDFRRPSRFSKEHLRVLQSIHEHFARSLSSSLSSYLRLNVRIQMTTVEQATFDEYVEQLPSQTVIYVMRMPPLKGPIILELSLQPTLAALDRLCGGPGLVTRRDGELTEIERSLLQPLGRHVLHATAAAWRGIIPVTPTIEDIVLNPQTVRTAGPNEIIALLVLELAVGDVAGTISLCLPYVALEPVMDQIHMQVWNVEKDQRNTMSAQALVRARLADVPLGLTVELGEVELSASAVLGLREGDVIRLGTPAQGELVLRIDGLPLFRCRPGLSSGNYGVRVTS